MASPPGQGLPRSFGTIRLTVGRPPHPSISGQMWQLGDLLKGVFGAFSPIFDGRCRGYGRVADASRVGTALGSASEQLSKGRVFIGHAYRFL
jgi:hypothetical protein